MSFNTLTLKNLLKIACCSGAMITGQLHAATNITSAYSVQTNVEGSIVETNDTTSGLISSVQEMKFNGNKNGDIRAAGTAMEFTDLGGGSFSYSAGSIGLPLERPAGWPEPSNTTGPFGGTDANIAGTISDVPEDPATKAKVLAGSYTTFTVTFDLAIGETRQANFLLDYTIEIANGNQNTAKVEWELTAPDMSPLGISHSHTRIEDDFAQTFNSPLQSAILDQPGTYTLTITSDIPYQEFNNSQKTASATLDAVYFEVVAVPEPSSATLLALTIGTGLLRRRR